MPRWEPPTELVVEQPKPRRWPFVVLLLGVIGVAFAGLWMIEQRQHAAFRAEALPRASDVRSALTAVGDSLEVVVSWGLTAGPGTGMPDSVRVEVGLGDGRESQTKLSSSDQRSDTLHLPIPAAGQTATGYSCVATVQTARLSRETCTPWQYVRPTAQVPAPPDTGKGRRPKSAATATVANIVIQPEGQQVDPDRGGKCAAWQREHPGLSVWIDVNREAVPDCTGPNGRPTVAKFCAFAVLTDGRRVKTAASSNDEYCERLFQAWIRERVA
jgi:hypothetical protein